MAFQTQEDVIRWYKQFNPSGVMGKLDEDVYNMASEWTYKKYGQRLTPYVKPVAPTHADGIPLVPYDDPSNDLESVDTSPDGMRKLKNASTKIGLFGLPQLFTGEPGSISKGIDLPGEMFDMSADFFKNYYNQSMAGMAYQGLYGEEAYEVKDYEPTMVSEAGGFLVGMVSIPEIAAFASGAKLGYWGAKGSSTLLSKYGWAGLKVSASRKVSERAFTANLIESGIEGGLSLGTLGAAHNVAAEAAHQRMTTGEINIPGLFTAGAEGFLESAVIGAPAGMISRGWLGAKYGSARLAEKDGKALDIATKVLYGAPSQVGAEILSFTALPNLYKNLGWDRFKDYPDVFSSEWNQQLFQNTVVVGTMASFARGMKKIGGLTDAHTWANRLLEQSILDLKQIRRSSGKIKDGFSDMGINIDPEMLKIINENTSKFVGEPGRVNEFIKNKEKLYEILSKSRDKWSQEEFDFVKDHGLSIVQMELGLFNTLAENKDVFKTILKDLAGRDITNNEFIAYKKILDTKIEEFASRFEAINQEIGINPSKIKLRENQVRLGKDILGLDGNVIKTVTKIVDINSIEHSNAMSSDASVNKGWRVVASGEGTSPDTAGRIIVSKEDVIGVGGLDAQFEYYFKRLEQRVLGAIGVADIPAAIEIASTIQKLTSKQIGDRPDYADAWRFLQNLKKSEDGVLKPEQKGYVSPIVSTNKTTIASLVNWLNSSPKLASGNAKRVVDFMEFNRINDINQFTLAAVERYRSHLIAMDKPVKPALIDVVNFASHASSTGFMRRMPWTRKQFKPFWSERTEVERTRSQQINEIVGEVIKKLGGEDGANRLIKETIKTSGTLEEQAYTLAHLQDGFGLRTGEVNKLKSKHVISSEGKYFISLDSTASKGKAREIPISRDLYKALKDVIKKNKIGADDLIFPNSGEIAKSVLVKTGITKAMQKAGEKVRLDDPSVKDVHNQMDLFSRKMTESKLSKGKWQYTMTKDYIKRLMGHESWSDKVYGVVLTRSQKRLIAAKLRDWMDGKVGNKAAEQFMYETATGSKYQLKGVGKPADIKEFSDWLDKQIKRNPGLIITKLKDAEYVGRFASGVIDVVMGKANKFTFFHENGHRLKDMIYATGNKDLIGIWKQAETLFKNDAFYIDKTTGKRRRIDMEEFIADELAKYALKRTQNKTVASKMKSWVNRLWSKIKKVIFGKEALTKNDVRNILGEKVFKGFEASNYRISTTSKFKYANASEQASSLEKQFNRLVKESGLKLTSSDKNAIIKHIAESAGVENPKDFKIGDETMSQVDMTIFYETMEQMPFKQFSGIKDITFRFDVKEKTDIIAKKLLTTIQQENILKAIGVKDGNFWKATNKQLKHYQDMLYSLEYGPEQSRIGGLLVRQGKGELAENMRIMDGILGEIAVKGLPVSVIIDRMGLSKLGGKLSDHISVELHHIGQFIKFESRAVEIFGKGAWEGRLGLGVKDSLYLMDAERYIERLELKQLTFKEKNFISKAFKSDWVILKDGKWVKNYKNPVDAINLKTKQGKIVKAWMEYTDNVYRSFKTAVKANLTDVEWSNFKKNNNIHWIKDNIYVSRLLTPEFRRAFNLNSKAFDTLVKDQAVPLAKKLAQDKYKTKNPSQEQIYSMMESAEKYVWSNLYDMFNFGKGKHSTRFLKPRHVKLPEFIKTEDGKTIKVYETKYEKTIKPYALGMSKFLANTEIFPEYVQLKGFDFPGARETLAKLEAANPRWGRWVKEQVENQLGYGNQWAEHSGMFTRGMANLAQILAKTQLSFPTSGLKNLVLGQTATLQAFRITDYFRALARVMSKEFRDEVKATGATEIGLRHLMELRTAKLWDKMFFFGFMKPTENFNRYMSIAASKTQQSRLVSRIRGKRISKRKSTKAIRRLKEFYKLSDADIKLLKKYGMGGVEGHKFNSSFEKMKMRRTLERVYQKMNTMAHINTQGASLSLFMPSWADKGLYRPLTLFKRMAYASSVNTIRNLRTAYRNGDYMKIVMTMAGPAISGAALTAIYSAVLGKDPPKENSGWAQYMYHLALRGEMLGIISDILRRLEGENAEYTMYPAIYNWTDAMLFSVMLPVLHGQKTLPKPLQFWNPLKREFWGQSGHDFMKETFGWYRGLVNFRDKKNNDFNRGQAKYRKLYYDFWDEYFPDKEEKYIGDRALTRRSKYYRDFRESFYKDNVDNFTKSAIVMIYAVATDLYNSNVDINGNPTKYHNLEQAIDASMTIFKTKLKTLNPNPGNFFRGDKEVSLKFRIWLSKDKDLGPNYLKELDGLESQYFYKIGQFKKLFPKYLKDADMRKQINKILKELK
jgi:hypothetical protein